MSQSRRDSPRSVGAVVSNLRSKYLSILSEEVEAEETEMDGRRSKTSIVESYAQKPSLVLIKAIRPSYPSRRAAETDSLLFISNYLRFHKPGNSGDANLIPSFFPPPIYPPSHLPALDRNRIIKPLIGALLPNPRSEFLLALSSLPLSI